MIYDLTTLEKVNVNLSMYSYEAILEGLFGVFSSSDVLDEKIAELEIYINDSNKKPDEKLVSLIKEIKPYTDKLDTESFTFLQRAQILLNKSKRK